MPTLRYPPPDLPEGFEPQSAAVSTPARQEDDILVSWDKYLGWYWRCWCQPIAYWYAEQAKAVQALAAHTTTHLEPEVGQ